MTDKEKVLITQKLSSIDTQMIQDFGNDSKFWTKVIQSTEVYNQILDPETKMYLEGTIYLCDCLITELRGKGVLK